MNNLALTTYKSHFSCFKYLSKRTKIKIILALVFDIIIISLGLYDFIFCLKKLLIRIAIINLLIVTSYILANILYILKTIELEKVNYTLSREISHCETLQLLHDNLRCFKHDIRNILQSLSGYIDNNDIDGMRKYYKYIQNECNVQTNLTLIDSDSIGEPAICSLIASKYIEALNFNITFEITALAKLENINIGIYNLSKILGILLDNAIAAAKDSNEKQIYFITEKKSNKFIITIENSYSNKDVNLDRIHEKGYTSKSFEEGSHGLGLWEVDNILKKSNNLDLFTSKNNEFFKQQLEIYEL